MDSVTINIVVISTWNLPRARLALRATTYTMTKPRLNIDIAVCPQLRLETGGLAFAEHGHANIV